MVKAIRLNPRLWERVKKEVQGDKQWNARIAQQAVKEYKRRGGKYSKKIPQSKTSLNKWTKEDWQYILGTERYLPKKVIEMLNNKQKREASKDKKLGIRKSYNDELKKLMKKLKIF